VLSRSNTTTRRTTKQLESFANWFLEEAFHVSTRSFVTTALVLVTLGLVSPVYAQETATSGAGSALVQWSIITAGFALGIAALGGALGQGKAVAAAVEAIARNPSASNDIRANLLLGLVLIESLVIYVLLISLILLFLGGATAPVGG
jgi:F-type H+-transporting ATPase subunit c